jgi:hypothetical protein
MRSSHPSLSAIVTKPVLIPTTPHPALTRAAVALIRPPARLLRSPHAQPVGFRADLITQQDSALLRRTVAFIRGCHPRRPRVLPANLAGSGTEAPGI